MLTHKGIVGKFERRRQTLCHLFGSAVGWNEGRRITSIESGGPGGNAYIRPGSSSF